MDTYSLVIAFLILHCFLAGLLLTKLQSPKLVTHHPLIGSLLPFYRNRRRLLHWYTDILAASPSQTVTLSRLGSRRTVVTANPSNVEHILKSNFPNYPKGKPFADILGDLLGCGIFNSDGHLWLSQRRIAAHAFTIRSLRRLFYHILRPQASAHLFPALALAAADARPVDLQDILRHFSFRVICHEFLGSSASRTELAEALEVASEVSAARGAAPVFLLWKAKRALGLGSERRLRRAVELVHSSVTDIIRRRRAEGEGGDGKEHDDKLRSLFSLLVAEGYGDEEIRDMTISFLMAGKDTTSAALTWFFWLVACHPEVEKEIIKELLITTKNEEKEEIMSYEWLKELKYLEASLMESMRLYPPVVWDSKHAAGDDVLPDGTVIRRGDRVTYFPYGMGRMEAIWGKDWGEFRPERWMEAAAGDGKEVLRVSPYRFPVFQAGPRVCLGKDMAMMQMKFVAAAVLRRFEVSWLGREAPAMVPLLTAHMAGGLPVLLKERGACACSKAKGDGVWR